MRIHELLEACLEYIAIEGVLGADPLAVRAHVIALDAKVDEAYFGHLWTLLAKHKAVEIVVAADELPGDRSAELPACAMEELFTVLGDDDGGAPPVLTTQLAALVHRYPSRLRVRCTEDEIYFRLTGSRTKLLRITPMIFTYLQLAARSRETGISAVELGPMTNANQKSVYHYMKVLCQLGLCAKIPASMYGANTSILVFRKFLEKNPNYQAHALHVKVEPEPEPAPHAVAEEGGDGANEVQGLGFDFAPFTEIELVAGHIPKERILKVLDHPGLKNHLLGNHHLLQVIGWPEAQFQTRYRRQLQRHIVALVDQGIIEYVDIGSAKRACLRLTKYNPDYVPDTRAGPSSLSEVEEVKEVAFSADDYAEPFEYHGGAIMSRSIESQVIDMVESAGDKGQTLASLSAGLSGLYKRTLDHIVNRQDLVFLPPNLRHRAVRLVMESVLRQRRLRVFTTEAYHQYLVHQGRPGAPPPDCPEAGHFADLSFRSFATSAEEYENEARRLAGPIVPMGKAAAGRPKGRKDVKTRVIQPTPKPKKTAPAEVDETDQKSFKYKNDVQERGRPRKYIYVVNEDGKRNRPILGDLFTRPELPQVLIYIKDEGVLVPAPQGYTGVGQPPKLSPQEIAAGKPPSFYLYAAKSAVSKKKAAVQRKTTAKGKGKGKRVVEDDGHVSDVDELVDEMEGGPVAGPSKRARPGSQAFAVGDTLVDIGELPAGDGEGSTSMTATGRPQRKRKKPEYAEEVEDFEDLDVTAKKPKQDEVETSINNVEPAANDVPDDTVLQFFTDAATEMAARGGQPAAAEAPAEVTSAPLPDDEPLNSIEDIKPVATASRGARLDIAVFRRMNEIVQCLKDLGGVFSEPKLWNEHKVWARRHEGTSHPNAPPQGAGGGMDRKVFRRTVNKLQDEGLVKERSATIPTTTGRWIKMMVIFLADTPAEDINAYIRHLANSAIAPSTPSTRKKADVEYSAYKRGNRASLAKQELDEAGMPLDQSRGGLTPREVYLSEPGMFGYLLGYLSGRCVRAKTLHCAAIKAIGDNPEVDSIVSTSPRIISVPFLFEQLRLKDFLSVYQVSNYDEDLANFCLDPANLELRLAELPRSVTDKINLTGRGAQSPKNWIRALLSLLSFLQLVTPLVPTADASLGTVHVPAQATAHPEHYLRNDDASTPTTYYLIHDVVPVYNIADQSMSLLGFMDAKEPAQLDDLWGTIKQASLHFHAALPRIALPPWPFAPRYSGVLTSPMHYQRTLRGGRKWRHEIPLVPGQRAALDAAISPTKRAITDPAEIAQLAHDLALPVSYVENFIQSGQQFGSLGTPRRRVQRVRPTGEISTAARLSQRQKERMAIRDELALRIRAAKEVYDQRVKDAAAAAGITVTPELNDYMVRNRPMKRMGQLATDQELQAIIYAFIRVQKGEAPLRVRSATRFQPSGARVVKKVQPASKPVGNCATCLGLRNDDDPSTLRRHRHAWTKEEEELLFDAETVVRARSRGQTPRGRPALQQIFPNISEQVLRSRLKKMMEEPGKQAYYQRLEDAFYAIIEVNRDTAELPDPNPQSQTDFPLRQWIDFVRPRVNKNLLRLPVAAEPVSAGKLPAPELMADVASLVDLFEWSYLSPEVDGHNVILEQPSLGEDVRLNYLAVQSVTAPDVNVPVEEITHRQGVTRAILKMVVATPEEDYNMQAATQLLSMPRDEYEPQIAALVNEGVLNKNSQFRTPGRMYSFALSWLQASESHLPPGFEAEVEETNEQLDHGPVSWPVVGKHGDLAALMTMVSNDDVEIQVSVDEMMMNGFNRLSYTTRSLTDADFECDMTLTRTRERAARPQPEAPVPHNLGFTALQPWSTETSSEPALVAAVLSAVERAGAAGIQRQELQRQLKIDSASLDSAFSAISAVFWAGYDDARIVSTSHLADWTVGVEGSRVGPRRWVDIKGNLIVPDWERALRSVTGHVMHRPGTTERDLRQRFRTVMDRMEMTEVLSFLVQYGYLHRTAVAGRLPPIQATTDSEARGVVYMSGRMWM